MQSKKDAEKLGVETFAHCHTRDVFRGFQEKQIEQFIMNGNISLHFLTDIYTLLQGWKCCKFSNSNLSCCHLSMVFDQSALSDLRPWHPHSTFPHTSAAYLYFWGRGNPCKPYGCDAVKIPVDQHFVKYSNQHIWHQQLHHIDSRLFLVTGLNALDFCHVIGWFAICIYKKKKQNKESVCNGK